MKKISIEEFVTSQTLISRRELVDHFNQKKVLVNETVITDFGFLVDVDSDSVKVNGQYIENKYQYLYMRFYKPKGILSTMEDPKGRDCIGDYIRQLKLPLKPVGRLDRQTSGIMLLTNDGDLAYKMTHPSFECEKRYECTLDKPLTKLDLKRMRAGFFLEDGPVEFGRFSLLNDSVVVLTVTEGRNRLVRRSFEYFGYKVMQLKRLSIGTLTLDGLEGGQSKLLKKKDVDNLKHSFLTDV